MILVTGATGMTGQFVVLELQQRNVPVRVLVREASAGKTPPGVDIAVGDLADFASLYRAAAGVTGIIHAACTFTDALVDVAAMGALLDGWRNGPFTFVSSLDVYGFTANNPVTEAHPLAEDYGDYGRGKVLCERLLSAKAHAARRTDFTLVRAPHILGPHPKGSQRFIQKIASGQRLLLPGADQAEWSTYRDAWIDVRDLARVLADLVAKPVGGPLNVLSGHFVWHDFYAELIRLTGSSSRIDNKPLDALAADEQQEIKAYAQTWTFDDAKLRRQLDFVPAYSLDQTLADMAAAI